MNQIHCVSISISVVSISGKKSSIFYSEELIFVPARRSFHLNDRNEDATTLYKQKAGKTEPLIGLKQFALHDKQLTNSCYKQPRSQVLEVASKKILSTNLWETFFFPKPLLAQSSKHLTFFRQGMYWDGIKMERPVIMKCCTIIC